MIDPVTALALASATFNGVKKAVQVGKEVSEIYTELSKWAGHVSDVYEHINQNGETKKPGLFEKITFSKSATAEAFDSFVAKLSTNFTIFYFVYRKLIPIIFTVLTCCIFYF